MTKPAYVIPSMADVAALKNTNGYTAVSTFSGGGGSCLGHEMAGFDMAWASEFVPEAQTTYRLNHPGTLLDTRDIRNVTGADILSAIGKGVGEIDLFDGSPPCSSFSTAGKRDKGWGEVKKYSDVEQRTDDLFYEYSRLIGETRPRTFVAENVAGLVRGTAKGYFQRIMRRLKAHGYRVSARVLDAQWLGVPQRRKRLIVIGVREDLELDPVFPGPLPYYYSVRDVLPWIGRAVYDSSGTGGFARQRDYTDTPAPTITVSGGAAPWHHKIYDAEPTAEELAEVNFEKYALYEEWKKLPQGGVSKKYLSLIRAHEDRPSPTVTAAAGSCPGTAGVAHPTEPRKFTIAELKRISSFPADFEATGTFAQQWERIGRAVPPLMMRSVAETIRDEVLRKADA